MNRNFRRLQAGFTLVEALVVLAIISLIAIISMTAFDGSKSKAQTMIAVMGQSAQGAQQFRVDVGGYPAALGMLLTGVGAVTFDGKSAATQWSRPYIAMQKLNGGNFLVDKIGSGVELSIQRVVGSVASPTGYIYYIQAANVPSDIVKEALRECNSNEADVAIGSAGLKVNKCGGVAAAGTFAVAFDQTR